MLAGQFDAVGAEWRRSRRCVGDGHCVELSVVGDGNAVLMRNSTAPETVLAFAMGEWSRFIQAVKAGELPPAH